MEGRADRSQNKTSDGEIRSDKWTIIVYSLRAFPRASEYQNAIFIKATAKEESLLIVSVRSSQPSVVDSTTITFQAVVVKLCGEVHTININNRGRRELRGILLSHPNFWPLRSAPFRSHAFYLFYIYVPLHNFVKLEKLFCLRREIGQYLCHGGS